MHIIIFCYKVLLEDMWSTRNSGETPRFVLAKQTWSNTALHIGPLMTNFQFPYCNLNTNKLIFEIQCLETKRAFSFNFISKFLIDFKK